jgi:enamine deaminase RidA (YjgF/YER057c/UK114 family)
VLAGRHLFFSGLVAGEPGSVVVQARDIYARMLRLLAGLGAGPDALVEVVEYVSERALAAYRDTAAVRRELLAVPFPASTGIVCAALGDPERDLAIRALGVLPGSG